MNTDRLQQLQTFQKDCPEDPFFPYAIALEYVKYSKDDEAKQQFEQLLSDFPAYVPTYYHFGQLLERVGDEDRARSIYEKGMQVAKEAGDMHTLGEIRGAFEMLDL